MSKAIKVFARIKPNFSAKKSYEILNNSCQWDELVISGKDYDNYLHNKPETHVFRFSKVFDQQDSQLEVFTNVAIPVLDNVLEGYNGTVFAYGQTGSGKTFSITGSSESYEYRGIIPRSIHYIFEKLGNSSDSIFTTYVSYFEIYNENGYDLLSSKEKASKLDDLPCITILEDTNGTLHLRNLSLNPVRSEKEAYDLLFLGDTNRVVAETPMNPQSSRSHCIFTLHVAVRKACSATLRRSKLHLIDLAGSERVNKSGICGTTLTEARYINLSLHYLENVITALGETARSHIPYRNSMMTTVLKDSLGGNCLTVMIATLSLEKRDIEETITTCRFAQRVSLVKNNAYVNIDKDPAQEICFLRNEIKILKSQLSFYSQECAMNELSSEDKAVCSDLVKKYLQQNDAFLPVPLDMNKIQTCFKFLKEFATNNRSIHAGNNSTVTTEETNSDNKSCSADVSKYKRLVQQRDDEISALLSLLNKKREPKISDNHITLGNVKQNEFAMLSSNNNKHIKSASSINSHCQVESNVSSDYILREKSDFLRQDDTYTTENLTPSSNKTVKHLSNVNNNNNNQFNCDKLKNIYDYVGSCSHIESDVSSSKLESAFLSDDGRNSDSDTVSTEVDCNSETLSYDRNVLTNILFKFLRTPAAKETILSLNPEVKRKTDRVRQTLREKNRKFKEVEGKLEKSRIKIRHLKKLSNSNLIPKSYAGDRDDTNEVLKSIEVEMVSYTNHLRIQQELMTEIDHLKHGINKIEMKYFKKLFESLVHREDMNRVSELEKCINICTNNQDELRHILNHPHTNGITEGECYVRSAHSLPNSVSFHVLQTQTLHPKDQSTMHSSFFTVEKYQGESNIEEKSEEQNSSMIIESVDHPALNTDLLNIDLQYKSSESDSLLSENTTIVEQLQENNLSKQNTYSNHSINVRKIIQNNNSKNEHETNHDNYIKPEILFSNVDEKEELIQIFGSQNVAIFEDVTNNKSRNNCGKDSSPISNLNTTENFKLSEISEGKGNLLVRSTNNITKSNSDEKLFLENIPLTGDSEIDEEILSFYKSRLEAFDKINETDIFIN